MRKLFAWVTRNERHLSTAVFVGGFLLDLAAYKRIDLPWVNALFAAFLIGSALAILVNHVLHQGSWREGTRTRSWAEALLPIGFQLCIGSLLSGCLIFYTRSADVAHSWPFILLLGAVFVGNEAFHHYRDRLTFQLSLFFFTLYAYAIFALPLAKGAMGSTIFLESGAASVVVFALFLGLLRIAGPKRLMESLRRVAYVSIAVLVLVNAAYFSGLLPPLPLSLTDAGIYHSIMKTGSGYEVTAETDSGGWFNTPVIHHVAGTPLFAYSAVFAPVALTTPIVHRWEKYDDSTKSWETVAEIAFSISGGRDEGYRGYSELTNVTPGSWRVSIETLSGSVLGTERFDVEDVTAAPAVYTEYK